MHNRIPKTNAAHNALCSAVCALSDRPARKGQPGSFGEVDYTPRIPTATTTLVTATGNGSLTDRPVWATDRSGRPTGTERSARGKVSQGKGQPGSSESNLASTLTVGTRLRFEGTLTPTAQGDKFRVLKDVSIVYSEHDIRAVDNLHVIQVRAKSPWRALRDYDRVAYTARVYDWTATFTRNLFVSIDRPILVARTGFNLP